MCRSHSAQVAESTHSHSNGLGNFHVMKFPFPFVPEREKGEKREKNRMSNEWDVLSGNQSVRLF